ncbi:MAG: O-antigen ligase family protein [Candidatus Moraniibacteriota bacterium]
MNPRLFNLKNLIYLTVFLSPTYLVKLEFFSIPSNFLDLLICAVVFGWIIKNKTAFPVKIKNFLKRNKALSLSVFLIITGVSLSLLQMEDYLSGLGIIKSWFILPLLFGFILNDEIKNNQAGQKVLNALFYSSFSMAFLGLLFVLTGDLTYDKRLAAVFLSPNHLAMFLTYGSIIGLGKIILLREKNYLLYFLNLTVLIALFFTRSYLAWGGLTVAIFFLLTLSSSKNKKVLLILSFVAILSTFFIFEKNSAKFSDLVNFSERSSLSSRLIIWRSSFKILSDNWLWGIGPGNFQNKYLQYQPYFPPYLEWAVPQPHSLFLAFYLQTGLIGFLGFIFLLISWIFQKIKILVLSKDYSTANLNKVLLALIIYTLFHGLLDTPYWKNDLALIFWIIIFLKDYPD